MPEYVLVEKKIWDSLVYQPPYLTVTDIEYLVAMQPFLERMVNMLVMSVRNYLGNGEYVGRENEAYAEISAYARIIPTLEIWKNPKIQESDEKDLQDIEKPI